MTIISAAIVNKQGQIILSRQFSDVSRVRIEGMLSAFPRLLESATNAQATYMTAGSVCYVYQPLEDMFLILITTIKSNLVEDLEMLHLISRVIPEYAPEGITQSSLEASAFEIFFAIDEIIAGGKREDTTIEQIQTYLEMDSYEEKMAIEARQKQVENARRVTKEQAKILNNRRRAAGIAGFGAGDPNYGGFGNDTLESGGGVPFQAYTMPPPSLPSPTAASDGWTTTTTTTTRPPAPRTAMRLSAARKTDPSSRVQREIAGGPAKEAEKGKEAKEGVRPRAGREGAAGVLVRVEETFSATLDPAGEPAGAAEVRGELTLLLSDPAHAALRLHLGPVNPQFDFRAHLKLHRGLFASDRVLVMAGGQPFPVQQPLTLLRWRLGPKSANGGWKSGEVVRAPIRFACWGQPGGITVEYELADQAAAALEGLQLGIPTSGAGLARVEASAGHADLEADHVVWRIGLVDGEHDPAGNIDLHLADPDQGAATPSIFFPITISFHSKVSVGMVRIEEVTNTETGLSVPFSQQVTLKTDRFVIE